MSDTTLTIPEKRKDRAIRAGGTVEPKPTPRTDTMTATTELTRHLLRLNADDLERVAAAIVDRTDSGVAPLIDDWRRDQCIELDDNEPDYLAHGLCFLAAEMRAVELDPSELEPSDAIVRDLELLVQQRTRVA